MDGGSSGINCASALDQSRTWTSTPCIADLYPNGMSTEHVLEHPDLPCSLSTESKWTMAITAQGITEPMGAAVTQGAVTGTLATSLQNEWTLAITAQGITENAGVTVTQGSNTGTLKTACQMEWTLTIASQVINEVVGVVVTQGSVTGTLKTALTGATTSVVVLTASGVTFLTTTDVIVGSTTVAFGNVNTATNTLTTTSVVVQTTSGTLKCFSKLRIYIIVSLILDCNYRKNHFYLFICFLMCSLKSQLLN